MTAMHPEPEPGSDAFERFATAVGDLDSPFYDEERDRDVWNEASAVGFQLMLWGLPLVSAVCLWVGGAAALPYAAAMLVPWAVAAATTLIFARRRAVDPGNAEALAGSPVRMWLFALVLAALTSGFVRAAAQLETSGNLESFLRGATQGGAGALAVVAVASAVVAVRERRRRQAHGR